MVLRLRAQAPGQVKWSGAKCLNFPPTRDYDAWFDEEGMPDAIELCNGTADGKTCPLRDACLNFALANNERYGVWGGTSEITRRCIRRKLPPFKGSKVNPSWEWMTEEEALRGLSDKEIRDLRNEGNESS